MLSQHAKSHCAADNLGMTTYAFYCHEMRPTEKNILRKRDPEDNFLPSLYDPALLEQRPKVDIQILANAHRRHLFGSFSVLLFVGHVRSSPPVDTQHIQYTPAHQGSPENTE